jgi:hypothetical protein
LDALPRGDEKRHADDKQNENAPLFVREERRAVSEKF